MAEVARTCSKEASVPPKKLIFINLKGEKKTLTIKSNLLFLWHFSLKPIFSILSVPHVSGFANGYNFVFKKIYNLG